MKYLVKTHETELYRRWYLVTAKSSDEAMEKIKHGDWYPDVSDYKDEYVETTDIEVLKAEPYNEDV
jgi:hypothetical protein